VDLAAIRVADGLGQLLEIAGAGGGDHDEAVGGAQRCIERAACIAGKLRGLGFIDQHADHRLQHRNVDELALAGALALIKRCLDRSEGMGASEHVGNENAAGGRTGRVVLIM
jgi:hypothetical protein